MLGQVGNKKQDDKSILINTVLSNINEIVGNQLGKSNGEVESTDQIDVGSYNVNLSTINPTMVNSSSRRSELNKFR